MGSFGISVTLCKGECYDAGSMARAAEHLAISQPVVSKMIAELERTVGVRLRDRGRHGAEPTLYGRALLRRGIAIFDDLQSSMSELESLADPSAGELRIGSTEPMMGGLLAAIVDRLTRQYPRRAVHIIQGDPPDLQDRYLRDHDIDLMIGRLPSATPAPGTEVQVLLHERAFVVAGVRRGMGQAHEPCATARGSRRIGCLRARRRVAADPGAVDFSSAFLSGLESVTVVADTLSPTPPRRRAG